MAEQQIVMKVPEEMIRAQVQAAVVLALGKDPESLVRAVVTAAMEQKRDSYNRESIWDAKVNEMIRAVAEEAFKEWLEEQRPKIRSAVRERLGASKTKVVDDFASKLVDGLIEDIRVSFHFKDAR